MKTSQKTTILLVAFASLAILLIASLLWDSTRNKQGLIAGFTAEFLDRPDGYPGLAEAYGLELAEPPKQMDPGLMYQACADGAVDVICAFATDGRIKAYGLTTLEDDKQFFPPYFAAPIIRSQTLQKHPEIAAILNQLAGRISAEKMRAMNLKVDRKENPMEADQAAREFLVAEGLINADADSADSDDGNNNGDTIVVGGKDFTEQLILGEIMAQLIEARTNLRVERKLYLGGTMICFNALKAGDLDLYAEYTGTGLVNILKQPVVAEPQQAYEIVKKKFMQEFDVAWLEPFGFNNTYTITMRKEQAERLGIEKISDLVE